MSPVRHIVGRAAAAGAVAFLATAASAGAVPAGTGVQGTVTASWGETTGSPITAWSGHVRLAFDPSAAARADTLAAARAPELGEGWYPMAPWQTQAARVTSLASDRTETVLCAGEDAEGNPTTYEAVHASSVASVADPRIAYEIATIRVDLLAGRGSIDLTPEQQMHPDGHWLRDRIVLPGRWIAAGAWPCPGDGAPATRLPRILAPHGAGAVPRAVMHVLGQDVWPLRRTGSGWRVVMAHSGAVTLSESPFGPQDTQRMRVRVESDLRLAGSLRRLGARCRVPFDGIERARTAGQAVGIAKRAGLTRTRFAGTRRLPAGWRTRFAISGTIDSQGHAPCMGGAYRVHRYAPER